MRGFAPQAEPIEEDPDYAAMRRWLPSLLAKGHEGRYAVFAGGMLRGVFESYEDAEPEQREMAMIWGESLTVQICKPKVVMAP